MSRLWLDAETFSKTPIKWGTYRYVGDTELMVMGWAMDDDPVQVIDYTDDHDDSDFQLALLEADEVWAHNAMFDRGVVARKYPSIAPAIERWRCSMVLALAHSLPGGLDKLCEILQLPDELKKLAIGRELVKLFCMPRPKTAKIERATRLTHPAQWTQFLEYGGLDVEAMRACAKRMPEWNYGTSSLTARRELALWHLDQRINDRGFAVDLELAQAAVATVAKEQKVLAAKTVDATNGEVESTGQRDILLEHILAEYNISLPDLKKSTIERRLADPDIPDGLKFLLSLRSQSATTSTSKYNAAILGEVGGRLRGTSQFCGAGRTGRWAHRMFQPGNMPRPKFSPADIDVGIEAIKLDALDLIHENVMSMVSSAIRGCIIAADGRKIVVADLANIEGRDASWLAGEEWKLQAFREYDDILGYDEDGEAMRRGPDLYKLAYSKSFRTSPDTVNKEQRQVGKVQELALGYEGGVGAFLTFSLLYNLDLEAMADKAWDILPAQLVYEAEGFHEWTLKKKRPTFGLSRRAFVVCDVFKRAWRQAHPHISSIWKDLEETAVEAVDSPGRTLACRHFKIRRDGAWLRIGLPSGRALCYPQPKLNEGKLSYMGVNQYTRQWARIKTYGGKLFENCCQAVARDVMAWNMPAIEDHGYQILLTVHDEVLTETPDDGRFTVDEMSALLARNPEWAPDMPLAAAGFEAKRYRKD